MQLFGLFRAKRYIAEISQTAYFFGRDMCHTGFSIANSGGNENVKVSRHDARRVDKSRDSEDPYLKNGARGVL